MPSLNQIAKELQRPKPELLATLKQFEIPTPSGEIDGKAHLGFLRIHTYLRLCQIPQASILQLWQLEMKLMRLLHLDTLRSPIWMIEGHLDPRPRDYSFLLSKSGLDAPLSATDHQTNLNFSEELPELFATSDMGEDFALILKKYLKHFKTITTRVAQQTHLLQAAANWSRIFLPAKPPPAT